jgi:hypothetical protein
MAHENFRDLSGGFPVSEESKRKTLWDNCVA